MHHITLNTPMGVAAVVYEAEPFRLLKIVLPASDKQTLIQHIPAQSAKDPSPGQKVLQIKYRILNYFKGRPIKITFKNLDLDHLSLLQQAVLKAVCEIPYGQTRSYGDIAASIGKPKAARFVGTTMASNPFPLLIPCHRVIKSDGSFGLFGGGTDLKARLIQHEKSGGKV